MKESVRMPFICPRILLTMQARSSMSLCGCHRSKRNRFAWCSVVLILLGAFHTVSRQDTDSNSLFASIGKTADSWSTDFSQSNPWSTVTSKLRVWQWENSHGADVFDEIEVLKSLQDEIYGEQHQKTPPKGQKNPPVEVKHKDHQLRPESYTITTFKKMWLENEIGGPITETNLAPITRLCANVSWHDDVVLNITTPGGGVGNLRTLILDFIYFAMQTGSHIILPSYIKRTEKTLYWLDESNGAHSFSHLFDTDFLISTLRTACPEMRVFQTIVEAEINGTVTEVFDLQNSRTDKVVDTNPREKISRFRKWVDTKPEGYQDEAVNMVTIGVPLFTHDMRTKPRMRMALGRLLKFNNKIRELAATVLFNLRRSRKLEAEIDPSKQIYHGAYYGMHLRTEADAGETWGGYEAQAIAHLDLCKKLNLSLIYVATGNQGDVVRFADEAQQVGITVISKQDLYATVEEQAVFDSSALDSLSWDQKGVLDYEILSRSSFFSGPAASSFTWNLVLRRAFYIDDERLDRTYAYGIAEAEPGVVYDDGLSRIDLRRGSAEKVDTLEFLAPEGMYP